MSESVYNLIKPEVPPQVKPKRYKSKFASTANAPTCSTFGFQGTSLVLGNVKGSTETFTVHPAVRTQATFGKVVGCDVTPDTFLHSVHNTGITPETSSKAVFQRDLVAERKPPIPAPHEKPVMGLKTDKNFVVANAVENILTVTKKPKPLPPRAVNRDDFGQVPSYLSGVKEELQRDRELIETHRQRKLSDAEKYSQLSPDEVRELRTGLQRRWEELNREFQTMGFNVETYSLKRRQETIEAELRAVEQALEKVKKATIIVYDDRK